MKKKENQEKFHEPIMKSIIAGSASRAFAATAMFPVDMIKTRLQFQKKGFTKCLYKNGFDAFWKITKNEGILALYSGLPIRLIYTIPAAAVSFTIYERMKYILSSKIQIHEKRKEGLKLTLITMLAGGGARFLGTLIRTPLDQMKMRMQVEGFSNLTPRNLSYWEKVKFSLLSNRGAFLNSYKITILRDAPFSALYFTFYEISKRQLSKQLKLRDPNAGCSKTSTLISRYDFIHLVSGSVAALVATTFTIPIDVVKTRVQTDPETYYGVWYTTKLIFREEGLRAFSKGLLPRILYLIPASSLTFAMYEKIKQFYDLSSKKKKYM